MKLPENFLVIDEEGYPSSNGVRITDEEAGFKILSQLDFCENGAFQTQFGHTDVIVEAFDEPLVALNLSLSKTADHLLLHFPYQFKAEIALSTLTVDEWDRFHGRTKKNIPFVLSRAAQATLLNIADEFDDDSITIKNKTYVLSPWLSSSNPDIQSEKYWSDIYQTEEKPGWEMNQPTPLLVQMTNQLKLAKSRVLVLGAGSGNDAAHFAQLGHWVTAVDISPEAISRGQQKYSSLSNLHWEQTDIFKLDEKHFGQYDIIFEHTCYCAIPPEKRNDLVKLWRKMLCENGKLMGIFFAMEKKDAPPFGGSEWELRERLKKYFQFYYWHRWRDYSSLFNERRKGKELFIYGEMKKMSWN